MLKEEVKAEAHIRTQATKYKIENTVNEIKTAKLSVLSWMQLRHR